MFTTMLKGAQIAGASSPWRLNYAPWRLIFVASRCVTRFMPPFWRHEFLNWLLHFFLESFCLPDLASTTQNFAFWHHSVVMCFGPRGKNRVYTVGLK